MAQKPFFIGWESTADPSIRQFIKKRVIAFLLLGVVIAGVTTAMQQTPSNGTFDFGNVQEFKGVLFKDPTPTLVGDDGRTYYLVGVFKNGFPAELAEEFHLQNVTLKGTLISDELESMIEVIDDGVSKAEGEGAAALTVTDQGQVTLRGEIVDSKCHLGVMNPGRFKPHRACAIQCLAGGIPPILVAQTAEGQLAHYLLVGSDGSAVNDAVIDYAAEPVEISGDLKIIGNRKVIYLDVSTIKRL